jgi:hypothetical protein
MEVCMSFTAERLWQLRQVPKVTMTWRRDMMREDLVSEFSIASLPTSSIRVECPAQRRALKVLWRMLPCAGKIGDEEREGWGREEEGRRPCQQSWGD